MIYGLFGGPVEDAPAASSPLASAFDDLYIYPQMESAEWKWRHGEQLIAAWYGERGSNLEFDSVFVVQWDMLLLRPISQLLPSLERGQALFSGLRSEDEVKSWWGWLNERDLDKGGESQRFREYVKERYLYDGPLMCCLFIVICLPRQFLELYLEAGSPADGFLEYKLPTLAKIWNIPTCTNHRFNPWWANDPATKATPRHKRLLNAIGEEADLKLAFSQLLDSTSCGILHPFRIKYPPLLLSRFLAWSSIRLPIIARILGTWD